MSDFPLTPYFFRKLGIFQALLDLEKAENDECWKMEKSLLLWSATGHHHLASSLNREYIQDRLLEKRFIKAS